VSGRLIAGIGTVIVLLMVVLAAIGTTSLPLFVGYIVMLFVGGAIAAYGLKREKAESFERLERERRQG